MQGVNVSNEDAQTQTREISANITMKISEWYVCGVAVVFLLLTFKSDSHLSKKCVICFIESSLKIIKNAFYFILEALFVLKIFKFLSWRSGHVGKTAWLER